MTMKKKLIAGVLASVLSVTALAGCGTETSDSTAQAEK